MSKKIWITAKDLEILINRAIDRAYGTKAAIEANEFVKLLRSESRGFLEDFGRPSPEPLLSAEEHAKKHRDVSFAILLKLLERPNIDIMNALPLAHMLANGILGEPAEEGDEV